jgi:hypothetical protein
MREGILCCDVCVRKWRNGGLGVRTSGEGMGGLVLALVEEWDAWCSHFKYGAHRRCIASAISYLELCPAWWGAALFCIIGRPFGQQALRIGGCDHLQQQICWLVRGRVGVITMISGNSGSVAIHMQLEQIYYILAYSKYLVHVSIIAESSTQQ